MSVLRVKEMSIGLAMLAAGLAYAYMTAGLPRRGTVDATFVPNVLAYAMILLGLLQILAGWRNRSVHEAGAVSASVDEEAPATDKRSDYMTAVKTLILFAGFTALLRPLGFPIAAAIYLFLQFIVLTPAERKIPLGRYAALAIVCTVVIFVSFRYGFDLILPAGPLTRFLP